MLGKLLVETRWIHFPYERTQVSALNLGDENEHTSPGKGGGGGGSLPLVARIQYTCTLALLELRVGVPLLEPVGGC